MDKSKKCFNKSDFCVLDVKSFPQVVKKSRRVVARPLKIAGDPQKDFYNKKNGALPHHGVNTEQKNFKKGIAFWRREVYNANKSNIETVD